jgi:hypothetical protein
MSGVTGSVSFGSGSPAGLPTVPPYLAINFIVRAA